MVLVEEVEASNIVIDENVNGADENASADNASAANLATVSSSLLTKKAGKKRSPAWNEFLVIDASLCIDGKARATCCHCKSATFIANSHYGTKNLNNHLKKCTAFIEYSLKIGKAHHTFDQTIYRDLIARAIIQHGYAFSWVEHSGNRKIHTYLNREVRTITRNTAKADCLKLHKSLMEDLKTTLKNLPGRVSLTLDMWTSCQTEGYLCLTAHYVDNSSTLVSRVLNFCHIETPHTGYEMYSVVLGLLKEWGIESKIFSITLDNASSNDKMQDYLKDSLNSKGLLLKKGRYFHVRCAAHVLNLIVQDGLSTIRHIVKKIRLSVKYVKWSEARKKNFKLCVTLADISETKALWLDVPTRWNSTYMMLDRAILYRDAFKELNKKDSSYLHFPEPEEWDKIEKVRDVLEPFCEITNLFSGSDYPTSNLYFENVWRISMLLRDLVEGEDVDIQMMAMSMQDKFDKYWLHSDGDDYNTLFAFAVILDPRYKKQFLKYCYQMTFGDDAKASVVVNDVVFKLQRLLDEYALTQAISSQSSIPPSSTSSKRRRKFDLVNFDKEEGICTDLTKSKLDVYLNDEKLDRNADLDVLHFWKENEYKYGELAYLVRDILAVPLTTVASESTFSIGGRILNKWRSSYLPENVEALITSRSWLYGYDVGEEEDFFGSDVDWNVTT